MDSDVRPSAFIKNAGLDAGWLETVYVNVLYRILRLPLVFRKNLLTKHEYDISHKLLVPADIILVGEFRRLGSLFNKSAFTHVLLYVGNGECIHADGLGVRKVTFQSLFESHDTLAIMRMTDLSPEQQQGAIAFAEKLIGRPFDFWFDKYDTRAWYCTELVCAALRDQSIELPLCALSSKYVPRPAEFINGLMQVYASRYVRITNDGKVEFTYY